MRALPSPRSSALALGWALAACAGRGEAEIRPATDDEAPTDLDPGTATGSGSGSGSGATSPYTYHDDVLPIFVERCLACHRAEGIGPMRLDDYAEARSWAPVIAQRTQERTMPPWFVTDDGTCQEWLDSEWLSDAELEVIARWAGGGTPEGIASTAPLDLPEPPTLAKVDWEGETPEFRPDGGFGMPLDEYRCFEIANPYDHDVFLTGYDVIPGNDRIVHHAVGWVVDMDADSWVFLPNRQLTQLLGADGRGGWPCTAGPGLGVSYVSTPITWAPGQGAALFPAATGLRLEAGHSVVLQMHYNLTDGQGQSDRTKLQFSVEQTVPVEAAVAIPDDFLLTAIELRPEQIPPGEPEWRFTSTYDYDTLLGWAGLSRHGIARYTIAGVVPHMHQVGSKMSMTHTSPDGVEQCAVDLFDWNFEWQKWYWYADPLVMEPGSEVSVTCEWDTTGLTEPVEAGFGSGDEMCLMAMYLVLEPG